MLVSCMSSCTSQQRWYDPSAGVEFHADGLSAEKADAVLVGVEGLCPKAYAHFNSALSDGFCDVYSFSYHDTGVPRAILAPKVVFRFTLNHVTDYSGLSL